MLKITDATDATHSDLNDVYRGAVYGEDPIFSSKAFDLHIRANDIDLRRSVCMREERGAIAALALIGIRGNRAWIGAFGVSQRFRGAGVGGKCLDEALRSIAQAHCNSVELEVLETNGAAKHLYKSRGFVDVGELFVWRSTSSEISRPACYDSRRAKSPAVKSVTKYAACWQREDVSIARQSAPSGIERFGTSWAILRYEEAVTTIVDIAAADNEVERLFDQLEQYKPLVLVNESAASNVSAELARRRWPAPRMQYRMIRNADSKSAKAIGTSVDRAD